MDKQLSQYFSGNLPRVEELELFQRIENDSRLRADFVQLQNLSAVSSLLPLPEDSVVGQESYEVFMRGIKQKARRKLCINTLKYVAVAVVLIISTVLGTLFLQERDANLETNSLYVPAGQRAQITLQDGTRVWLNAQSTLTYPSRFSRNSRDVEVVGEAFFDVAKGQKPFVVSTPEIELQVLGTRFNVYAYPDGEYTQADLIEGSLRIVEKRNNGRVALLNPNEQMVYRNHTMEISPILNPDRMLWKKGVYSFHNERLIDIIEKLQLYYDVKIVVEDPDIFNVRYTGKFRQRDGIHEILRIIQKIQPFKIEVDTDNNIITLTK